MERMECVDMVGGSASPSPCSSYQPSPCASYNPSTAILGRFQLYFRTSSAPTSPGKQSIPTPGWLSALQIPTGCPASPTFILTASNPFGLYNESWVAGGSSRMWTPGQSGTCSPAVAGWPDRMDVHMSDASDDFAFGSSSNGKLPMMALKSWEGEKIHEECGSDELELTLRSSRTRGDA